MLQLDGFPTGDGVKVRPLQFYSSIAVVFLMCVCVTKTVWLGLRSEQRQVEAEAGEVFTLVLC